MSTSPRLAAAKRDWGHDESGCTILHIDMDAFYASCEVARHPELRGKPVIIGTGSRSVVSAASYEARPFGVNSAMPVSRARRLCPQGIFLPVDMHYYRHMSRRIFDEVCSQITDRIERVSVDEEYMDVGPALRRWKSPSAIARWIRTTVQERFSLTCSVGIASNKLIAKMASTNAKPNGMLLIPVNRQAEFVQMMPLRAVPGIGPSLEKKLNSWGINSVEALSRHSETELLNMVTSPGLAHTLFLAARGQDERQIVLHAPEKSIGAERTFSQDTNSALPVLALLRRCSDEVASSLRSHHLLARTITVKLRFDDLSYRTKAQTIERPCDTAQVIYPIARSLFQAMMGMDDMKDEQSSHALQSRPLPRSIRLAGVSTSGLTQAKSTAIQATIDDMLNEPAQLQREKHGDTERAVDSIRQRYGKQSIHIGL
ncbi:DNA polymerase IV [Bifidobacterium aquikefiricola]|uniref:DNA polymerase IV n=1 Tax=Bifidobacterium aquikefiricola TaxID=3059038 RepID=A0AB39U5R8_9BIFI